MPDAGCDGGDVGAQTCQTLGYAGGALRCGGGGSLDVVGCAACEPPDHRLLGCGPTSNAPPGSVVGLAVSASFDEIAVLWQSADLHTYLALFDPDLALRLQVELPAPATGTGAPTVIASSPAGWILSLPSVQRYGADLWIVSRCGAVTRGASIPDTPRVAFAARPGAMPLVAWIAAPPGTPPVAAVRAGLLAPDGRSIEPQVTILPDATRDGTTIPSLSLAAAFVGDGFLIASTSAGITLARVEADGTFSGATQPPLATPGLIWDSMMLVSDGQRTELSFVQQNVRLVEGVPPTNEIARYAATLDGRGAVVGPATAVAPDITGIAIAANHEPFGLAVSSVGVELVSLDGTTSAPVRIASDPYRARLSAVARRGADLVAAWVGAGCTGRLHLARLAP